MKIGLAIAPANALPSAFVVFRMDLDLGIKKAAELGYDGVELAIADATEVNVTQVKKLIKKYNLQLPIISTGRVFAEKKVSFTHFDDNIRNEAIRTVKGIIELAANFGADVNVGRVRGNLPPGEEEKARERFIYAMRECADFSKSFGRQLLLEPVNRYETNFINNLKEGMDIIKEIQRDNVKLMPDIYHMNIEDASIEGSLEEARDIISYIHFADSNRLAPGQGHIDFKSIIDTLRKIGYDGFITVEILAKPDPDRAAKLAIDYLRNFI